MTCLSESSVRYWRELSEMLLNEITQVLLGSSITAVSLKRRLKEGEILF